MNKEKIQLYGPIVISSTLLIGSSWLMIRAITNYLFLMIGQFLDYIPAFRLFGNPLHPTIWGLLITAVVLISGWLMSTKIKRFQSLIWRNIIFFQMFIGVLFYYAWFATAPIYNTVIPYIMERVATVDVENVWHEVLIGQPENLLTFIMFFPSILLILICIWLSGQYARYSDAIRERFEEFEFVSHRLQSFVDKSKKEQWPDIVLGPNSNSRELVIQPGKDRTLNNIIVGSIGTGKTAALVMPILNQDLHWMAQFINAFPDLSKQTNYHTEDVKGMYLNGISVIEPSNDLCQKTYKLVKAHNIPEKSVFYIDPTNPNTPNINPMKGPVDQVAEAFAMVIDGLAEGGDGGNFFFQQSERNHLKHYIYLLKLHDPKKEVTFDMLLDMYNNAQLVREMHVKLKETFPEMIDTIEDRDERNHWKIVQQIDEWFDLSLLPKTNRSGQPEMVKHGTYRGKPEYFDAKAKYVQGLRNILNDIGANKLLRRVLFGTSNFDIDKHLEFGGVLLVNTAKGEMGGLSNVLGKLILLSLQNAVFRRKPAVSSFHHILVDEFPDYIYRPFREFPAQSRKYKTIVTVVCQTITQLADKYGETYMHTLLGTLRHKMVYGDIPEFDARLFSAIFGDEKRYTESQNEQSVSPLQEQPMLRSGSMYTMEQEVILSPSDLIYQKEFQAAVKIVKNNRPIPAVQIDANFVPKEEFDKAAFTVEDQKAAIWWDIRESHEQGQEFLPVTMELNEADERNSELEETITELPLDEVEDPSSAVQPYEPNKINQRRIKTNKSIHTFPSIYSIDGEDSIDIPSSTSDDPLTDKEDISIGLDSNLTRTNTLSPNTEANSEEVAKQESVPENVHAEDNSLNEPTDLSDIETSTMVTDVKIDEAKEAGNAALGDLFSEQEPLPEMLHQHVQERVSQLGKSQNKLLNDLENTFQSGSKTESYHEKQAKKNTQIRKTNQKRHFDQF